MLFEINYTTIKTGSKNIPMVWDAGIGQAVWKMGGWIGSETLIKLPKK